jgi:murein DD-endopeptidase MepM/ murein hydrolase activator NlpD
MRSFPPRPGRPRRLLAAGLACLLLLGAPGWASAEQDPLRQARQELRETKAEIRSRAARMRALQRELNRLATRIAATEAEIHEAGLRERALSRDIRALERRLAALRARLAERARAAYVLGPGTPILYLLTASSTTDMASRLGLLEEMNRRDALLAARVMDAEDRLTLARDRMTRLQAQLAYARARLRLDRERLRRKLIASREAFAALQERKREVLWEISRIHPFAVCPVQGPHAISDSFGIWVERSEKRGGDHVHQGVDIAAPLGTPIVAPFDGYAVTANNRMGGLAVKVYGEFGYVYNAHLSRFGKLGTVSKGDVIGYVGATGNALGSHDHFEWHPGGGAAADPYPFLMQVC